MLPVLLASASPRRRQLLEQVGFAVSARPVDVDERPRADETAIELVTRLAEQKANEAIRTRVVGEPKLGFSADTIVWTDRGHVLGKPANGDDAIRMLRSLSGTTHHVTTGYTIFRSGEEVITTESVTTDVEFRPISEEDAEAYVATGEPFDKAGSYGIQGMGAVLVLGIVGSYTNVVGLPVAHVVATMRDHDLLPSLPWSVDDID